MKCGRMEVLLSCYLDGELNKAQTRQVADHLEQCASCSSEYRTLKKNQMMLSSLSRKEPSAEVWAQIQKRISDDKVVALPLRSGVWRTVRRVGTIAACFLGFSFMGITALGYYSPDEPQAPQPQVSQRSLIEGHARFMGEVDPMSDKAAWAYVRSHQAIQNVLDEESPSPSP